MDIDFDALHVFVVVVDCGGFNAAAQVLFCDNGIDKKIGRTA
jgi:hypothetical protein